MNCSEESRNQNGSLSLLYTSALCVVFVYKFLCTWFVYIKYVFCELWLSSLRQDRLHSWKYENNRS